MNYGKLAMLHRMAGCAPISVYTATEEAHAGTLYRYLQELCNNSRDLYLCGNTIVTRNPFLAHQLKEVVQKQTMVPQTGVNENKTTEKKTYLM